MLTFVLAVVAIATWVAAMRYRPRAARRCAGWRPCSLLGIPAQAVLGGFTVLTDLNPWVVALHLLLSLAMVVGRGRPRPTGRRGGPAADADRATAGRPC